MRRLRRASCPALVAQPNKANTNVVRGSSASDIRSATLLHTVDKDSEPAARQNMDVAACCSVLQCAAACCSVFYHRRLRPRMQRLGPARQRLARQQLLVWVCVVVVLKQRATRAAQTLSASYIPFKERLLLQEDTHTPENLKRRREGGCTRTCKRGHAHIPRVMCVARLHRSVIENVYIDRSLLIYGGLFHRPQMLTQAGKCMAL